MSSGARSSFLSAFYNASAALGLHGRQPVVIEQAREAAFEVNDAAARVAIQRNDLSPCLLNIFLNVPSAMTTETLS
jgi:hypothetical protein